LWVSCMGNPCCLVLSNTKILGIKIKNEIGETAS
jgi:hypothetical protein